MDIDRTIRQMARDARQAAGVISRCDTAQKNQALTVMADLLERQAETIFRENRKDLKRAKEAGLSKAMVDRLTVSEKTIAAMAGGTAGSGRLRRSGGVHGKNPGPAQRAAGIQNAHPFRRDRHHLRIAAQCHHRCRRALPEIRKCRYLEGRVRGTAFQPGACRHHWPGPGVGRLTAPGRPGGAHGRPRSDQRPAGSGGIRGPDHSPRR
jgi:hypothetical protein